MSIVEIDSMDIDLQEERAVECCTKHVLIDPIFLNENRDYKRQMHVQHLEGIIEEKNSFIMNLQKENTFLKEQIKLLNNVVNQLTLTSSRSLETGTKNDIRISVENLSNPYYKRWLRRPKIVLSGSCILLLFSVYLRYKIKNW